MIDIIDVGQQVKCKPYAGLHLMGDGIADEIVYGTVIFVNNPHRWFMVEYGESARLKVCFNFTDLGKIIWKI